MAERLPHSGPWASSYSFCLHLMMIFGSGGYEPHHEWNFLPLTTFTGAAGRECSFFSPVSSACVVFSSFCLCDLMCWIFTFPLHVVLSPMFHGYCSTCKFGQQKHSERKVRKEKKGNKIYKHFKLDLAKGMLLCHCCSSKLTCANGSFSGLELGLQTAVAKGAGTLPLAKSHGKWQLPWQICLEWKCGKGEVSSKCTSSLILHLLQLSYSCNTLAITWPLRCLPHRCTIVATWPLCCCPLLPLTRW